MSRAAAEPLIEHIAESLQAQDVYSIALSGGSTPRRLYTLLANDSKMRRRIPWERVHFFWGDERHVAADHPDSNYRMAFDMMLRHSPIPVRQIYRMEGEVEPKQAAQDYENRLQSFFGGKSPRFDLVLLGLGDDGHTASLFPGTKALRETKRWVIDNYVRKLSAWRLTMTARLINQAANVTFLVSGKGKAQVLQRVLAGRYTPEEVPAQIIRPERGQLRWLMDADAAELL